MRKTTLLLLLMAVCSIAFAQRADVRRIHQLPKSITPLIQPLSADAAQPTIVARRTVRQAPQSARRAPRYAEPLVVPSTATTVSYVIQGDYYNYSSQSGYTRVDEFSPADAAVAIDGTDIYIQGLAHWFPQAWVKGTISGSTVTVPTYQYLDADDYGAEYLCGSSLDGTEEKDITFAYDAEAGTLTLDSNTRIDETDADKQPYGYWKALTMAPGTIERPDVVVVPDGLEGETWELTGTSVSIYGSSSIAFDVTVYIDGTDIYIKGLDSQYLTQAVIKGTIADGKATFASPQYLGTFMTSYDLYFIGTDRTTVSPQVVFTYDSEAAKLTLDEGYVAVNGKADEVYSYFMAKDLTIAKPAPEVPVVAPDGLATKTYPLSGKDMLASGDLTGGVKVGVVGTDVYVQGLFAALPEAWVKGTLADSKVTFPVQYVGTTTDGDKLYLAGYSQSALVDFVLGYDAEADTYQADGVLLANPNKRTFSYDELLGAYTGVFFGTRPTPTAAPDEIETVSLPLSGKDGNESKVAYDVKVGFVGNEVYIQGIYKDMPDAWIRGELNGGKTEVSFPYGQCLGVDSEGWNIYLAGDEGTGDSYAIAPVVFSYDASYNYFELQNTLYFNGRKNELYYFDVLQPGATINVKADATWVAAADESLADRQPVSQITIDEYTKADLAIGEGTDGPIYYGDDTSVCLYAGNTITFSSTKEISRIEFYMTGSDKQQSLETAEGNYESVAGKGTWTGMAKSITFSVPDISDTQARILRIDVTYVDYGKTLCEAPADLVTEDYKFLAATTDYSGNPAEVNRDVKVGFYGDSQVFIQGLCEYLPESWVRGDIVDGKLVIPNWFFGTEHFEFMGYVFDTDYIFGGASLDYDADKKEFASAAGFVITDSDNSTYEYSGVRIVKNADTAISSLKVQTATEGSYYNISGVRVAAPAKKGIYIHNGRKFVVK